VEVLRQMVQAAKAIGNTELENKFAAAITAIKRDIVFAPSLVGAFFTSKLTFSISEPGCLLSIGVGGCMCIIVTSFIRRISHRRKVKAIHLAC